MGGRGKVFFFQDALPERSVASPTERVLLLLLVLQTELHAVYGRVQENILRSGLCNLAVLLLHE